MLHQMHQNKFSEVLSSLVHESCFSNYLHGVHGATKEGLGFRVGETSLGHLELS